MQEMYEDLNDTMVPDSTALRDLHAAFHHGLADTVIELFDTLGPVFNGIEPNPTEDTIDNDPTINAMLTARNI